MLIKLLEFQLPHGAGGMTAQMVRSLILKRFERFKQEHGINFHHFSSPYTLEVWFDNESDYTFFTLMYDPSDGWRPYRLVEVEVPREQDQ
jgi:hypothetical protein